MRNNYNYSQYSGCQSDYYFEIQERKKFVEKEKCMAVVLSQTGSRLAHTCDTKDFISCFVLEDC